MTPWAHILILPQMKRVRSLSLDLDAEEHSKMTLLQRLHLLMWRRNWGSELDLLGTWVSCVYMWHVCKLLSFRTGQIKMCRWDLCLPSVLLNNTTAKRRCNSHSQFVCRITVSLAHCPHPRGILFFEVHPSQCIVFVMAIQRELPITLLIRKDL